MSCKRITAVLLSAIVAFSVCVPAFGAEDAQTLNTGVPVNEEEPASPESADRSEEPALLEYADETEESASLENAGGTEEPDSADLLEEPNAAEEQPDEEQAEQTEQLEEDREAMSERAAGKSIAQAIWTQGDETLTFYYGPPVSSGKGFKGEIATRVWSGKDVTENVGEEPAWVDYLGYEDNIVHIVFDDSFLSVKPTNTHAWFRHLWGLTDIDLGGLDTSEVTDMSRMFYDCDHLVSLDVSGFDTSKVGEMKGMFDGCSSLTSLDLSTFNTSKVGEMDYMFNGCSSLTSLDLSKFDTSNVINMEYMFAKCSGLTSLDVSGFDTSKVLYMGGMFSFLTLTSLDLSGFDTSELVVTDGMFRGCKNLKTIYCQDNRDV